MAALSNQIQLFGVTPATLTMSAMDNLDFIDPEEEAQMDEEQMQEEESTIRGARGGGRRGPDMDWRELDRYIVFIICDIEALQWMTQTAAEFNRLTDLLVQHYSTNPALTVTELDHVSTFFAYFLQQWGPGSHVQNWYAGDKSKQER